MAPRSRHAQCDTCGCCYSVSIKQGHKARSALRRAHMRTHSRCQNRPACKTPSGCFCRNERTSHAPPLTRAPARLCDAQCVERSMHSNCPVCFEFLFDSVSTRLNE
jgi:hypothetical protein